MKTKNYWLLVGLLGLALTQAAEAYYNPSTGRWLNRDPIVDRGSLRASGTVRKAIRQRQRPKLEFNLFLVARNDPVGGYDYLGLDHRESCCPELNLWTPCEAVCRMAWFDREANHALASSGGTVICYHGKACGCVGSWNTIGFDPGECPEIDAAVKKHEDNHAKKAKCKPCGLHPASNKDEFPGVDMEQEECEQRRLTISDLEKLQGTMDESCEKVAAAMISALKKMTEDCPK